MTAEENPRRAIVQLVLLGAVGVALVGWAWVGVHVVVLDTATRRLRRRPPVTETLA